MIEKESAAVLCEVSAASSPLLSWLSMASSSTAAVKTGIQTSGGGTVIMVGFIEMGAIARSAC